jgi:hypothetical protein
MLQVVYYICTFGNGHAMLPTLEMPSTYRGGGVSVMFVVAMSFTTLYAMSFAAFIIHHLVHRLRCSPPSAFVAFIIVGSDSAMTWHTGVAGDGRQTVSEVGFRFWGGMGLPWLGFGHDVACKRPGMHLLRIAVVRRQGQVARTGTYCVASFHLLGMVSEAVSWELVGTHPAAYSPPPWLSAGPCYCRQ